MARYPAAGLAENVLVEFGLHIFILNRRNKVGGKKHSGISVKPREHLAAHNVAALYVDYGLKFQKEIVVFHAAAQTFFHLGAVVIVVLQIIVPCHIFPPAFFCFKAGELCSRHGLLKINVSGGDEIGAEIELKMLFRGV